MPQYFGQLPTTELPWSTLGAVNAIQRDDRGVRCECGGPCFAISVLAKNLIRVRLAPTGEFMPRRSWAVTLDDPEWPVVPFEVRETDVAVEIATEQMGVRVQRQECRITCFDSAGRLFAQDTDMGMGWRLGATVGWKQIEAEEHFYGFGERTGLLDKLAYRVTNWTTDALDYGSLTDEMYQAIPFFMALRPEVGYGIFSTPPFGASLTSVQSSLECGKWKRAVANWTTTLFTAPSPPRFSAPTPSLLVGCRCRLAGRLAITNVAGATNLKRSCVNLHGNSAPDVSPAMSSTWILTICAATVSSPGVPSASLTPPSW